MNFKRYKHPGGLTTNANPNHGDLNGMDFERPMVDQYFAMKNEEHWYEEDCARAAARGEEMPAYPDNLDWQRRMYITEEVERTRFIFYPTTKKP